MGRRRRARRSRSRGPPPEADLLLRPQGAVDHAHQQDHAAVAVVPAVEQQHLERRGRDRRRAAGSRRTTPRASPAMPRPSLAEARMAPEASMPMTSSIWRLAFVRIGRRQIDLVDHRDDGQVVLDGHVDVGQGLRLHALRGVHHQQRPLARRQRARHLVVEVHVAGRIDQVQLVGLPVLRLVRQAHRRGLDGDAALALEVHVVEELVLLLASRERAGGLEQPIGQRGLAVVDVRDDGEVADEAGRRRHERAVSRSGGCAGSVDDQRRVESELPGEIVLSFSSTRSIPCRMYSATGTLSSIAGA